MRVYQGDPVKLARASPTLSNELLGFVQRRYGLTVQKVVQLGGSWNLNVLVNDYVIRVYGPWVEPARLQEIQRVRRWLQHQGILLPALQPAGDGSSICTFEDCCVEVEQFIAGTPMETWQQLCAGFYTLGQLHRLMADISIAVPPPAANHLPEALALPATEDVLAIVRAWQPTEVERRYADAIEELVHLLPVMQLPVQLVHGDFKDNNVVFREANLVAVLDFDFMGVRPRIDDLALPLHTLLERGVTLSNVCELVARYEVGNGTPLSAQERQALPYAMARMALSYLQYVTLPGDQEYSAKCRREFSESRGPACQWWLRMLKNDDFRERGFTR